MSALLDLYDQVVLGWRRENRALQAFAFAATEEEAEGHIAVARSTHAEIILLQHRLARMPASTPEEEFAKLVARPQTSRIKGLWWVLRVRFSLWLSRRQGKNAERVWLRNRARL